MSSDGLVYVTKDHYQTFYTEVNNNSNKAKAFTITGKGFYSFNRIEIKYNINYP